MTKKRITRHTSGFFTAHKKDIIIQIDFSRERATGILCDKLKSHRGLWGVNLCWRCQGKERKEWPLRGSMFGFMNLGVCQQTVGVIIAKPFLRFMGQRKHFADL